MIEHIKNTIKKKRLLSQKDIDLNLLIGPCSDLGRYCK